MEAYYDDYDDFPINQTRAGGGSKDKRKDKKTYGGSCYNSKYIRVQEAKKENSKDKKSVNTK